MFYIPLLEGVLLVWIAWCLLLACAETVCKSNSFSECLWLLQVRSVKRGHEGSLPRLWCSPPVWEKIMSHSWYVSNHRNTLPESSLKADTDILLFCCKICHIHYCQAWDIGWMISGQTRNIIAIMILRPWSVKTVRHSSYYYHKLLGNVLESQLLWP